MQAAYEAYVKIFPDVPRPSLKGIGIVLGAIGKKDAKAAAMQPEQLVDTTTLDGLEREGFFKALSSATQ
jgi:hypothetical protein